MPIFNFRNFVCGSSALRFYAKLSFFVAVVAPNTAYCSIKKPEIPGIKMRANPNRPIINLEKIFESIEKKLHLVEFNATAPLYPDKERTYIGYSFESILSAINIDSNKEDDLIIVKAKDGFQSYIPKKLIQQYKPLIAISQKYAPSGQSWELVKHSLNGITNGGPFYLMWPATGGKIGENFWAFGIKKITYGSSKEIFGELSPKSQNHNIQKGLKLFKENCSCCHTFMGKGLANVGPDFGDIVNKYPLGMLAKYAAKPPENSLMPPQDLSEEELNFVEEYIREKSSESLQ